MKTVKVSHHSTDLIFPITLAYTLHYSLNHCECSDHFCLTACLDDRVLLMEPDMNENSINDIKKHIPVF